ncbi:MAG: hypothetical protein MZV70_76325 [Desulfobacterales bacterium]|nr:hypothetical protein [Desulfobacterales bacterium]
MNPLNIEQAKTADQSYILIKYIQQKKCAAYIDKVTQDDIKRLSNYMLDEKYMGISLVCPKDPAVKKTRVSPLNMRNFNMESKITLKVRRLEHNITMPEYATQGAAGMDLSRRYF